MLDSRRVLAPSPKVLGPKHISHPDVAPFCFCIICVRLAALLNRRHQGGKVVQPLLAQLIPSWGETDTHCDRACPPGLLFLSACGPRTAGRHVNAAPHVPYKRLHDGSALLHRHRVGKVVEPPLKIQFHAPDAFGCVQASNFAYERPNTQPDGPANNSIRNTVGD